MKNESGISIIELVITSAILVVGVVATIASYQYITTSLQYSKGKTLANNLVTEQVEKLKNLQYYSLLVTTTSIYSDTRFSPPLDYDTGNYPAQTIIQGGMTFTRATRVDFAYQSGNTITTTTWTSSDTGLKMITVYTIWQDGSGLRYQEIHNLMANPAANPLNSTITGRVRDASLNNIAGAIVRTIDNPNWYGTTNTSGIYQFNVSSGTYTLNCSSQGYFATDRTVSVAAGASTTADFTLSVMSSGTASGFVYIDTYVVVSQVVVSTDTNVEYVELYNPTSSPVNIGTVWPTRSIDFYIFDPSNNTQPTSGMQPVPLVYVSTYIASNKYYLIANTPNPIHVAGQTRTADAYYTAAYQGTHLFTVGDAGGTGIATASPVNKIDAVAWDKTAVAQCPNTPQEGNCIDFTGTGHGIGAGERLIRMTSPGTVSASYGRAYDTDDNATNFSTGTITSAPDSMSQATQTPITGKPAGGAYITLNDSMSSPIQASSTGYFTIPGIATGTWTMTISSGSYYARISTVTITANVSTSVPNGSTSPTWPASTVNNTLLTNTTNLAFVSGVVTDANNAPLSGIQVLAGGTSVNTNSSGRYFTSTSTGDALIIANYNNANKGYSSQTSLLHNLSAGIIYDNPLMSPEPTWFTLTLSGTLVGYFQTSSLTALPGQTAVALSGGNQVAQAVSDNTGHFYLSNLSTGTYTISPALDSAVTASPTSTVITLSSTGTATAFSTFTVTSGLAEITGQVTLASSTSPITTGVLVIATTATLSGASLTTPPSQDGGTGALCAPCYYSASSDSTGLYSILVRSSTTSYKVYGWYTSFSGSNPTTTSKGPYPLNITTAGTITSQNISW